MDIFGQTFVFFVVYDWNHTAAFASLLLGCAAISLPLMPLFGIGMTKLGPRWNGDAFPGLCRRLGLCGWIRNTFPGNVAHDGAFSGVSHSGCCDRHRF